MASRTRRYLDDDVTIVSTPLRGRGGRLERKDHVFVVWRMISRNKEPGQQKSIEEEVREFKAFV